jgi:hypothetical protein
MILLETVSAHCPETVNPKIDLEIESVGLNDAEMCSW